MDASTPPRRIPLKLRRLHTPNMYKMVFAGGKALRGSPLTLRYFRAAGDISRVGFIIRKKTGDAPLRNSIRRTLRRCFQETLPGLVEGTWLVFDVSDKAAAESRGRIREVAQKLLRDAATAAATAPAADVSRPPKPARPAGEGIAGAPAAERGRKGRLRKVKGP